MFQKKTCKNFNIFEKKIRVLKTAQMLSFVVEIVDKIL